MFLGGGTGIVSGSESHARIPFSDVVVASGGVKALRDLLELLGRLTACCAVKEGTPLLGSGGAGGALSSSEMRSMSSTLMFAPSLFSIVLRSPLFLSTFCSFSSGRDPLDWRAGFGAGGSELDETNLPLESRRRCGFLRREVNAVDMRAVFLLPAEAARGAFDSWERSAIPGTSSSSESERGSLPPAQVCTVVTAELSTRWFLGMWRRN